MRSTPRNKALRERAGRLPPAVRAELLQLLNFHEHRERYGQPTDEHERLLEDAMTSAEAALRRIPFPEPTWGCGIDEGDVQVLTTPGGNVVGWSFRPDGPNAVKHVITVGPTGCGKTVVAGLVAGGVAAVGLDSLFVTTNLTATALEALQERHVVVFVEDFARVWNPFRCPEGLRPSLWDQRIAQVFAASYEVIYGLRLFLEALHALRGRGVVPTFSSLREQLESMRTRSWSRRNQWLDAVLLNVDYVLGAFGQEFGKAGRALGELFPGNYVLVCALPSQHTRFLVQLMADQLWLARTNDSARSRELVFLWDEAQVLEQRTDFLGEIMLQARQAGLHLFLCFQNAAAVSSNAYANADLLISMGALSYEDRRAFGRSANLSRAEEEALTLLDRGAREVVGVHRTGVWRSAFLAQVDVAAFKERSVEGVRRESGGFVEDSLGEGGGRVATEDGGDAGRVEGAGESRGPRGSKASVVGSSDDGVLREALRRFVSDVTTKAHEFSPQTKRLERAGIRGSQLQQRVVKRALEEGLVVRAELAVGRGRPIMLVEATEKGFALVGATPWRKGRGGLATRAATHLLLGKLGREYPEWTVIQEGRLGDKQVDLLLRDAEGRVVAVEIAGNAKHEVHNALHCLACPEVKKHVVVGTTGKVLDAVKRKFAGFEELKLGKRLELVVLSRALREDWTP